MFFGIIQNLRKRPFLLGGKIAYFRKKRAKPSSKATKKKSTPNAKPVSLNSEYWLRNSSDIKKWAEENKPEDGLCPILKFKPTRWVVDHDHFDSRTRGVISQNANTWEGYILKSFSKYCGAYTEISLSEALRNLAHYFEQPYWLNNKLHCGAVEELRRHLNRCTKETIASKALKEYDLIINTELEKRDMVQIYLLEFVKQMEETTWE